MAIVRGVTLRATRQAAFAVLVVGGVVDAIALIAALAFRQPSFLTLAVFGLATQAIGIAVFMVPLTVTTEGGELVRRSGGRETRVPLGSVANCSLVGGTWVFSNAGGAQLFTLQAIRFNTADVAAFCQAERIDYQGPSQNPVDVSRSGVRSAKSYIALGLFMTVACVAFTAFGYWLQVTAQDDLGR
ncbi:MAG TPA: hypothetical protein VM674_08830, partial [Candidatus Acidoferrum sp.]|nr:hypothetical protein [Candidatus Acidoferrum sp.]